MFKNIAGLASMMKQASQITGRMSEMQTELREKRVKGAAGGGMVEVESNGLGEMLKLEIDPDLIAKGEKDVIEDLVRAAANDAHKKSRELHVEAMKSLGLFGAVIPEAYGGLGLRPSTYAKIIERISRVWMSVSGIINSHLKTDQRTHVSKDRRRHLFAHLGNVLIGHGQTQFIFSSFRKDGSKTISGKVLKLINKK